MICLNCLHQTDVSEARLNKELMATKQATGAQATFVACHVCGHLMLATEDGLRLVSPDAMVFMWMMMGPQMDEVARWMLDRHLADLPYRKLGLPEMFPGPSFNRLCRTTN